MADAECEMEAVPAVLRPQIFMIARRPTAAFSGVPRTVTYRMTPLESYKLGQH